MSLALVTGASGMLGSYIAARLGEEGLAVRGLARNPEAVAQMRALGIEPRVGDLRHSADVVRAAQGCVAIFHAAAAIGSGGDASEYERTNVAGTAHVVEAAARVGARLVHVSSTAVFGAARYRDEPTDEEAPLPGLHPDDAYGRTKQGAESLVLDAQRGGRVWATVVRPPMMYGRRDRQFVPRVAPLLRAGFFPLPGGGKTTLPLVHADAVADGAVRAFLKDTANGRVFHLTSDFPCTVEDMVRGAARGLDRPVFAPGVPAAVARLGFAGLAIVLGLTGRSDLARHAKGTLEMLLRPNPFSDARARRELGWAPRIPPSEGLADAFAWWRLSRPAGGAR